MGGQDDENGDDAVHAKGTLQSSRPFSMPLGGGPLKQKRRYAVVFGLSWGRNFCKRRAIPFHILSKKPVDRFVF